MLQILPNYNILAYQKQVFNACTQAATTTTVALATTYTGLVLSNPNKSNNNLYLLRVGVALAAAPAAPASIGIMGGISTTDVTHTTPATVASTFLGYVGVTQGVPSMGLADTSATLPVAPTWLEQLMGGFTAAALPSSPLALFDFAGSWVIPPGGFIAVGTLTAVSAFLSMTWAVVPQTQ